jgi:hypothetical protein
LTSVGPFRRHPFPERQAASAGSIRIRTVVPGSFLSLHVLALLHDPVLESQERGSQTLGLFDHLRRIPLGYPGLDLEMPRQDRIRMVQDVGACRG